MKEVRLHFKIASSLMQVNLLNAKILKKYWLLIEYFRVY